MSVVQLQDVRMNYLRINQASLVEAEDVVVFIHGMASSLGFWSLNVTQALAERHQILLLDLRGHGRSSTPRTGYKPSVLASDVLGLMNSLGVERAHVVAHSFGGAVALHLAHVAPDRVSTLTLADTRLRAIQPKIDFSKWIVWTEYRDCLADAGIEDCEAAGELGAALFTRMARVCLERPEQFKQINKVIPTPFVGLGGGAAARRWLQLVENTNFLKEYEEREEIDKEMLSSISSPALLLYGELSQSLPTANALSSLLPDSRFQLIKGAGHFFPVTRPEKMVAALNDFFEEAGARAPALLQ